MSSINRKIIRILSTFTPDDWKRFGLFIKSPYFVSWRNYSSLYNKFYKHYKLNNTLDDSVLDKIISEVFKKNKLSNQTIRNRLSEFESLAQKYIQQKYFDNDKLGKNYHLLKHYLDCNLYKEFESMFDLDISSIVPSKILQLDFDKSINILSLKVLFGLEKQETESAFTDFYNGSLLKSANFLKEIFYYGIQFSIMKDLNVNFEFNPFKDIIKYSDLKILIGKIEELNSPLYTAALLFYYMYEIIVQGNVDEFLSKFEKLFNENDKEYEKMFRYDILITLIDFFIGKIVLGESNYEKTVFGLYKKCLENGYIPDTVRIMYRQNFFNNFVIFGLRIGEHEEVKKFISLNIVLLPENIREDEYILAMVRYYAFIKDYSSALSLIEKRKGKKHNYKILLFKLRVLYELSLYEEAMLEADRIKHYIKKSDTITKNTNANISVFIYFFIKLIYVNSDPNHKKLDDLIVALNKSTKLIPHKAWFNEKIQSLKNKNVSG